MVEGMNGRARRWAQVVGLGGLLACLVKSPRTEPNRDVKTNAPAAATLPTNRLAREKSPYLLQHQHNPVDWYPWGEEAFAKARQENKPVFLSVGYSTCH